MDIHQIMKTLGFATQETLAAAFDPPLNQSAISHWKRRGIGDAVKRRLEHLAVRRGVDPAELELD